MNLLVKCLGVTTMDYLGDYLTLPSFVSKSKSKPFWKIKEQMWKVLQGWKGMFFSASGKKIRLKVVAQEIPNYMMSCFRISFSICKDLNNCCVQFLWNSSFAKSKTLRQMWLNVNEERWWRGYEFQGLWNV